MRQFYSFGVKSIIKHQHFLNYIKEYKRDPLSNDNEVSAPTLDHLRSGSVPTCLSGSSATFSVDESIPFHTTIQPGQQPQFRRHDKKQNMTRKRKSVSPICPQDAHRTDLHEDQAELCNYNNSSFSFCTRLQLVPRQRKCGFIHPLPHTSSWRSA
jgi:hypothetical protein